MIREALKITSSSVDRRSFATGVTDTAVILRSNRRVCWRMGANRADLVYSLFRLDVGDGMNEKIHYATRSQRRRRMKIDLDSRFSKFDHCRNTQSEWHKFALGRLLAGLPGPGCPRCVGRICSACDWQKLVFQNSSSRSSTQDLARSFP